MDCQPISRKRERSIDDDSAQPKPSEAPESKPAMPVNTPSNGDARPDAPQTAAREAEGAAPEEDGEKRATPPPPADESSSDDDGVGTRPCGLYL